MYNVVKQIFQLRKFHHYNLRHPSKFIAIQLNCVCKGKKNHKSYLGSNVLEMISSDIKIIKYLCIWKIWKPGNYLSRSCKAYIQNFWGIFFNFCLFVLFFIFLKFSIDFKKLTLINFHSLKRYCEGIYQENELQ